MQNNNDIISAMNLSISNLILECGSTQKLFLDSSLKPNLARGIFELLLNKFNENSIDDFNIKKLALIQIKNFIGKNWKGKKLINEEKNLNDIINGNTIDGYLQNDFNFSVKANYLNTLLVNNCNMFQTIISLEDKKYIKENIFNLILFDKDISNIKIYMKIIYKILKYEENWDEYSLKINEFLSLNKPSLIYFGLETFYQLSKLDKKINLEGKKNSLYLFKFNEIFKNIYLHFERILENIFDLINITKVLQDDPECYLMNKILNTILKIFCFLTEEVFLYKLVFSLYKNLF